MNKKYYFFVVVLLSFLLAYCNGKDGRNDDFQKQSKENNGIEIKYDIDFNESISFVAYKIDDKDRIIEKAITKGAKLISMEKYPDLKTIESWRYYNNFDYIVRKDIASDNLLRETLFVNNNEVYYKQFTIFGENPGLEGYTFFRYYADDSAFVESGAILYDKDHSIIIDEGDHVFIEINSYQNKAKIVDLTLLV
ncbi:MAG: hypothetical protein PHE56_11360, partial [Bacteroidales bacterium]|nr:hypothetical protein [Bacteroidales bacterium]